MPVGLEAHCIQADVRLDLCLQLKGPVLWDIEDGCAVLDTTVPVPDPEYGSVFSFECVQGWHYSELDLIL